MILKGQLDDSVIVYTIRSKTAVVLSLFSDRHILSGEVTRPYEMWLTKLVEML